MKAAILAGGKGTRMKPVIGDGKQKTMVKYSEKPLLQRTVEILSSRGFKDIVIVVSYEKEQITEFFGDGSKFGVNIEYVVQENPKGGTADAVRYLREKIQDDRFLLVYGDNIFSPETLDEIIARNGKYRGILCVKEIEDPSKYGIIQIEGEHVKKIIEKPEVPPSKLALIGLFVLPKEIFNSIEKTGLSQRGEYEITDSIQMLIDDEMEFGFVITKGFWTDPRNEDEMKLAEEICSKE